jgi:hypothetical protein
VPVPLRSLAGNPVVAAEFSEGGSVLNSEQNAEIRPFLFDLPHDLGNAAGRVVAFGSFGAVRPDHLAALPAVDKMSPSRDVARRGVLAAGVSTLGSGLSRA